MTAGSARTGLPPILRPVLAAFAVTELGIGGWQLFAPHSFYSVFPTGQGWVEHLGAYDQHLVTDVGELTLALGFMLAMAAFFFQRRLVQVALGAYLVQAVPHLVYHVGNREHMSTGDNIANIALLGGAVVVPAVLLAMTLDSRSRRSYSGLTRRSSRNTTPRNSTSRVPPSGR